MPCVCTLITHRWGQNMVRTKKYATSCRRVAWLMFLPCFDVLCALSEYRPTAKWNLFVLYNNQDFWPNFASEHHVDWAESKTFKQSCDPLNYTIIRKNFTNNNLKTNLYCGRNFGPQNITACQSLHWLWFAVICDRLLAINGFLSAYFGQLFPSLTSHNKVRAFFNLVEVTLNGLCPIFFIAQFSIPAKICLFLSANRKNSLQNFVDQSLYLDSVLITCADHVRRSHH